MKKQTNGERSMGNPYAVEPAVITKIRQETNETKTYTLEFIEQEHTLEFVPGQFNMISLLGIGEGPFSITSSPLLKDGFEQTIRRAGNLTSALDRLNPGDIVSMRGPYGTGWPVDSAKGKDLFIIAGGVGLAPLRGLINLIVERRGDFGAVEIMYGSRKPDELVFTSEYDAWRAAPNISLLLTVDEVPEGYEWPYGQGVVTNLLSFSKIDPANALAFVCGPEIMMRFVARSLTIRGVAEENIFVSLERRMECGMAKCGRCMLGRAYVCTNGPVFSYPEVKSLPQNLLAARF
ncbi:MAG TPA: FAD/NAD(P)-binding protein [Anaerolineae bacterium]|nr:FAD/NAD(P)-binding protein [Anaerolineae bacterium]